MEQKGEKKKLRRKLIERERERETQKKRRKMKRRGNLASKSKEPKRGARPTGRT